MPIFEFFPHSELDELAKLEIEIARRADELKRVHGSADSTRDFWHEAEEEVLATYDLHEAPCSSLCNFD